ncbi:hypothetical protein ACFWIA_07150 [Streptomyces sp. NPDC127068]|uniref:hypothetical protein n=1 Tax=Streptomyces sp. NPDC127068 TaxID=3347127 RepID=UPI00364ED178
MFRMRTAFAVTAAALVPVLGGAPGAVAVDAGGASAAVTPSVVAPGGSFTLIVDCSAVPSPTPRVSNGQGLAAPLVFSPAGGGRFQSTGRLSRDLTGATAVGLDGDCGGPGSRWIASMLVGGSAASTSPVTRTPAPVSSAPGTPAPVSSAPSASGRAPAPSSGSPTAGGVRGGLGGTFAGHPTPTEVMAGTGLLAAGVLGVGLALRRRARARRH